MDLICKLEKWAGQHSRIFALLATALFFAVPLVFCKPLLNSGDDVYFMYTLGGGYGEPPSALLHYNNGWNFLLTGLLKKLFEYEPAINWYTLTLLLLHYLGCAALFFVLLKKAGMLRALFLFALAFIFFELRQILSLNYTGAAFTAGTGGLFLLMYAGQTKGKAYVTLSTGSLLILLAGLLRMQVAWLVFIIAVPVAATVLQRNKQVRFGLLCFVMAGVLWGLNKAHEQYYQNNIPGWEQQEEFRQALFYAYNRQLTDRIPRDVFADSTEQALYFSGFLYDTAVFSTAHVKKIGRQITRTRSIFKKEDRIGLYWFWIEMRVYLLLFAAMLLLYIVQRKFKPVRIWLFSLLIFAILHCIFFVFLKITLPLHLGLLLYLWMALAWQFTEEEKSADTGRKVFIIPVVLILTATAWMSVRLYKENSYNRVRNKEFECALRELNQHPEKLFVATDDSFPISQFYIWKTPQQYPATNLIYKDRQITFTYKNTLGRFGISEIQQAILNDPRVYLLGKKIQALEKRYDSATLSAPLTGYQCLEVRQLKQVQ